MSSIEKESGRIKENIRDISWDKLLIDVIKEVAKGYRVSDIFEEAS